MSEPAMAKEDEPRIFGNEKRQSIVSASLEPTSSDAKADVANIQLRRVPGPLPWLLAVMILIEVRGSPSDGERAC